MSDVIVWGGGGHARVVADVAQAMGLKLIGVVDRRPLDVRDRWSVPVIKETRFLEELASGARPLEVESIVLGIGDNAARHRTWTRIRHFPGPALVHPSAIVSPSACIGAFSVVFPGAIINANAVVEEAAVINSGAVVEHDCVVEAGAHVSPNATLCGGVSIGIRTWVGAGATVLPGLSVATDSMIGAGAVVVSNVEEEMTIVGVPGRAKRA